MIQLSSMKGDAFGLVKKRYGCDLMTQPSSIDMHRIDEKARSRQARDRRQSEPPKQQMKVLSNLSSELEKALNNAPEQNIFAINAIDKFENVAQSGEETLQGGRHLQPTKSAAETFNMFADSKIVLGPPPVESGG